MRFDFRLAAITLLLAAGAAQAGVDIQHWQTAQGARVYYVNTPTLPMVDVRVTFDAGSARDGSQFGIAELTSSLLGASAGDWSEDEVAARFESVGAQFSSSVSEDMATLSLRSLTDKPLLDKALETFRVVLTRPAFNAADFQREKNLALAALQHREESPAAAASIAFHKALYGDHPYAHPEDGFLSTVTGFEVADLKTFYQRYYVAANAVVVIVGALDRQQAEMAAQAILAGLPVGEKPADIPPPAMPVQAVNQHIDFPSSQTHVLSGTLGTYRKDPDYFPLYVGNYILGGGSLVSRLFEEVREKRGLAYSASSMFLPLFRQGPFVMSLQTRNDEAANAVEVMDNTLRDFTFQGPTDAELQAARQNITGGFAMRVDTNAKVADYVTMIGFYQQPLDYLDVFPGKVEAVTAAEVRDAFQRHINPELLQTVTVGGKPQH